MSDLDRISFRREWIKQVRNQLEGPLPSGRLGDWAFLFREQLTDALARTDDPLLAELAAVRKQLVCARDALEAAEPALAGCYQVVDYPADGSTSQDHALALVQSALKTLTDEEGTGK